MLATRLVELLALRIALCLASCQLLSAQCPTGIAPGDRLPGVFGVAHGSLPFDPDGAGPLSERLLIHGQFPAAGNVITANLVVFDPQTGNWSPLGNGIGPNGTVHAATLAPSGELFIGGSFTSVDGVAANGIARWNGSAWSAVGAGLLGLVNALAFMPNGDMVAGGNFAFSGSTPVANVARWNGSAWSSLGSGVNSSVRCLLPRPNGELIVGGFFSAAGSVPCSRVARWDGSAWSPLGSGVTTGSTVLAMDALPNGDVVMGGNFTAVGGVATNGIARWNGSAWSSLGNGLGVEVLAVLVLPNGEVVAGGSFLASGGAPAFCARWDGSSWSTLAPGGPNALLFGLRLLTDGSVVATGVFTTVGAAPARAVARWNGTQWSGLSTGIDNGVAATATLPDGRLVVGGRFTTIGATVASRVAVWDGSQWASLGAGLNSFANAVAALPNGDIVAGGIFTQAGGNNVPGIARWSGNTWSSLGLSSWPSNYTGAMALLASPNGELFAASSNQWSQVSIVRWDGTSWTLMPVILGNSSRSALVRRDNGNLIAVNQCIQEWDGSQWLLRGCLLGNANAVVIDRNGDIVIGGNFTNVDGLPANNIARWSNGTWSTVGSGTNGPVASLLFLPDGDLLAGGSFTTAGGNPAAGLARYRGNAWAGIGSGVSGGFAGTIGVECLTATGNEVFVGGNFWTAGGNFSAGWARLSTPCPTVVASTSTGCAAATQLVAETLPWVGSIYSTRTEGLVGSALALDVVGFAPSNLLLASVLPQAAPGCLLTVQPDLLSLLVVAGGMTRAALAIPGQSSLVGQQFFQQTLSIQLGAAGELLGIDGSNRLALTIGSW